MSAKFSLSNGIPTGPDVEKLSAKFGTPQPGATISYSEIEKVIQEKRESFRFKSVTIAWRKKLEREANAILGCVRGAGFSVLDPSQRVEMSGVKYKHGLRSIGRGTDVAARTSAEHLNAEDRRTRDHLIRVGTMLRSSANAEAQLLHKEIKKLAASAE